MPQSLWCHRKVILCMKSSSIAHAVNITAHAVNTHITYGFLCSTVLLWSLLMCRNTCMSPSSSFQDVGYSPSDPSTPLPGMFTLVSYKAGEKGVMTFKQQTWKYRSGLHFELSKIILIDSWVDFTSRRVWLLFYPKLAYSSYIFCNCHIWNCHVSSMLLN